jgi:hypothetical protein
MDCTHHWKLASPAGATVRGVCTRCGVERDFPTAGDDSVWETGERRVPPRRGRDTDPDGAGASDGSGSATSAPARGRVNRMV